jgi:uracil-DNA glycosylase family protein
MAQPHIETERTARRSPRLGRLKSVIAEAAHCTRCPLYRNATQTVFGEGAPGAHIMFVGEQPGDKEDIAGRPFVGPAGRILDRALVDAGIEREDTYVTNAVKHFKNEPRGKRRIHKRPNMAEVEQCRWWLEHEIKIVKPTLLVALGATAARTLLGRDAKVQKERGRVETGADGLPVFITIHPSSLLRLQEHDDRATEYRRFVADMKAVKRWRMRKAA